MGGWRHARDAARVRFVAGLAGALVALAIAAPVASAAQMPFGSDLTRAADGTPGNCSGGSPCGLVGVNFPAANSLPATSPIAGVVTKFLIRSSAQDTVDFRLARHGSTAAKYTLAALGPRIDLNGANVTQAVDARVPVAVGDYAGIDDPTAPNFAALNCGDGGGILLFSPPLAAGDDRDAGPNSACELLVEAIAEPDADGDLFGDDSQDNCPGVAGPNNGCAVPAAPAAQAAAAFDLAAAIKACKKKKRKKARKRCIKRVQQQA